MSPRLLTDLTLVNFRCFSHKHLKVSSNQVVIVGQNGAGKSSALEAAYYSCYARSPRQTGPAQMAKEKGSSTGALNFAINLGLTGADGQTTSVGVAWSSTDGQISKFLSIDGNPAKTHRKILDLFKIELVDGADLFNLHTSPDWRRGFLGSQQFALDSAWPEKWSGYKKTLAAKTALLSGPGATGAMWLTWTEIFWLAAWPIVAWRKRFLAEINNELLSLVQEFGLSPELAPSLAYKSALAYPADPEASFDNFAKLNDLKKTYHQEVAYGRSAWGPHLEDWTASLGSTTLRHHASRGQQKLFLVLLRVAAVRLGQKKGVATTILALDDFLTDLDPQNLSLCLALVESTGCQIILTSPDVDLAKEKLKNFLTITL